MHRRWTGCRRRNIAGLFRVGTALVALAVAACGAVVPAGDGETLNRQGLNAIDRGEYGEAEPLLRQALAIRRSVSGTSSHDLGQSLYNLGYLYRLEGRTSDGEQLLRQSLAIRETPDGANDPLLAQNLNELGYLYQLQGRATDAEPLYRRALAIQQYSLAPDDPAIADTLLNLGYLSHLLGRTKDAEQFYNDSIAIRRRHPADEMDLARALNNLGNLYRLQGRNAEAEPLETTALEIRQRVLGSNHIEVADSLTDLGALYQAQHRYVDAERALQRGLSIRERALGEAHPDVALKSLDGLVTLYMAEGRNADALHASDRAVAALQRHLDADDGRNTNIVMSERRLYRDEMIRDIGLLASGNRISPDAATIDRSFQVAQLATASTAGAAVANMAARFSTGSDRLAAAIRELQDVADRRQQLDAAVLRQASRPTSAVHPTETAALRSELETADEQLRGLESTVAHDFPEYAALTNPAPVPVAAVQTLLANDESMLVYVVGPSESWLWAIRKDRAALYTLGIDAAGLSREVSALRAKLDPWQNPSIQPFPALRSNSLYQRIMAPAAALLDGAQHIIVVPDGALESLPFSVLVTSPPRNDPVAIVDHRSIAWLARDHALTVLPTVGSLQALRRFASHSRAPSPFLGIGDPALAGSTAGDRSGEPAGALAGVLAPHLSTRSAYLMRDGVVNVAAVKGLPPLPETAGELRTIEHVLGASDGDLFLGDRAREPVIRNARLNQYKIIEFATHGLMSGDLGLVEPALVLTPPAVATPGDDGLLTSSKIATMKLDADWVVLSACNTAASDGTPEADGLSGLARAFFYAGARSMLVSHWSVNSLATVKLTTGAFAALARDPAIGRAEALRRSMMAMLDPSNAPELSHPLAWAPFVLAGEGGASR